MTNPLPIETVFEMLEEGALYRLPDGAIVRAYLHDDEGLVWGLSAMLGEGYDDWYAIDVRGAMVRWWLCSVDPSGGFPAAPYLIEDLEPWPPTVIA